MSLDIESYNVGDILKIKFSTSLINYNALLMVIAADNSSGKDKSLLNLKNGKYIPLRDFRVNIISIEVKKRNYDT